MNKTANYNLKKPEVTDPLRVADFNENADIIDAALKAATSVSGSYASTPGTKVSIDLGFRPKLVFVMGIGQYGYGLSIMMDGMGFKIFFETSSNRAYFSNMAGGITDSGFYIASKESYLNEIADRMCYYTVVR